MRFRPPGTFRPFSTIAARMNASASGFNCKKARAIFRAVLNLAPAARFQALLGGSSVPCGSGFRFRGVPANSYWAAH